MKLRISARQSELAQIQAYQVGQKILEKHPEAHIEYFFRESLGDQNQNDPLWKMPTKGVFTEDFKADLINDKTDLVVHSWKDLPTEKSAQTSLVATLERADQRDLLFFKKKSCNKKNIQIYSSSPRRAYNLTPFLKWALPFATESIQFQSVRGNMTTRIRKWLESETVDGLVLAKAAVDRLLSSGHLETQMFIKNVLTEHLWMVTPLSENPNAAAQGALAIEVKSTNASLIQLLEPLNCFKTFSCVTQEREYLQSHGGGCHLALGMSHLIRPYGDIQIIKGQTPDQSEVDTHKLMPLHQLPANITRQRLKFISQRLAADPVDVSGLNALYVTKAEAWNIKNNFLGLVWTSGLETWKKLSLKGVWVHGSHESLGENEETRVENYLNETLKWGRLSHNLADPEGAKKLLAGYQLQLSLSSAEFDMNKAFVWMSPLEFDMAVNKFPEIQNALHICGPGRTFEALKKRVPHANKLFIEMPNYN